jgi:hypothetical protein
MTPVLSFEAHQTRALLDQASALLVRSRRLLADCGRELARVGVRK